MFVASAAKEQPSSTLAGASLLLGFCGGLCEGVRMAIGCCTVNGGHLLWCEGERQAVWVRRGQDGRERTLPSASVTPLRLHTTETSL